VFEALARYSAEIEVCVRAGTAEGDARWIEIARKHHRLIRNAVEEARRLALGGRARRAGETRIGSNLPSSALKSPVMRGGLERAT